MMIYNFFNKLIKKKTKEIIKKIYLNCILIFLLVQCYYL